MITGTMERGCWVAMLLAGLLGVLLSGCAASVGMGGGGSSFVSTTINNTSRARVNQAVRDAFQRDGFTLVAQGARSFQFRKRGGRSAEIIYGSWFTEGVAVEPEVVVLDKGGGTFAVHCDVYMREHSGRSLLDANHRVLVSGRHAYNRLMHDIKRQAEGG